VVAPSQDAHANVDDSMLPNTCDFAGPQASQESSEASVVSMSMLPNTCNFAGPPDSLPRPPSLAARRQGSKLINHHDCSGSCSGSDSDESDCDSKPPAKKPPHAAMEANDDLDLVEDWPTAHLEGMENHRRNQQERSILPGPTDVLVARQEVSSFFHN
jgi:hypothetical protein